MHAVEQVVGEGLPRKSSNVERREARRSAVQGFSVDHNPKDLHPKENVNNPAGTEGAGERPGNTIPGAGHNLSILIGGKLVHIKDQIQLYTTNQLISHPLVSPVLQPSLGGLPPLFIITGGGELLRDEQIYLAHKAAHPSQFPPGEAYLDEYPEARDLVAKWKPTDVQLQVWDDLCHVAPTLSFTRPAKFMYRSIAQFGAWVLARAQKTEIEIMDDDELSLISMGSDTDSESGLDKPKQTKATMENGVVQGGTAAKDQVGKAGDPLPAFKDHMIRQRVNRHGQIFALDPPASIPALQISANEVGVIKPGPVEKWLSAKKQWDQKYAREKRKVQKQRAREMAQGFQGFGNDEVPPPSALAGRRGLSMPKEEKKKKSWGMSMWSLWGSSHDENTVGPFLLIWVFEFNANKSQIQREERADKEVNTTTVSQNDGANARPVDAHRANKQFRSRSRRRRITDAGQTDYTGKPQIDEIRPTAEVDHRKNEQALTGQEDGHLADPTNLAPPILLSSPPDQNQETAKEVPLPASPGERPSAGYGNAFPFKLGRHPDTPDREGANASTITLTHQAGVVSPNSNEIKTNEQQTSANLDADQANEHFIDAPETPNHQNSTIEPIEDAHGEHADIIDRYDLRGNDKLPPDGESGNKPANSAVRPAEGRRGTLEDAKGVLFHGPGVVGPLSHKKEKEEEEQGEEMRRRPGVDRSDTASLD